jgi:putative addiction module component (TIGR02574 family)
MITVNLSIDQLVEAIQNLTDAEKQQIRDLVFDEDIALTEEQQQEVLRREQEYKSGKMKTYSIEEVKASLNYKD